MAVLEKSCCMGCSRFLFAEWDCDVMLFGLWGFRLSESEGCRVSWFGASGFYIIYGLGRGAFVFKFTIYLPDLQHL